MARPRKQTSEISKYRMNLGIDTPEFAEQSQLSIKSITRLENGEPTLRVLAAKYLKVLQMDLNHPSSLPAGWIIEDRGEKVVFLAQEA